MLLEISGPKSTASVLSAVEGNEASFNPLIFPSCLSPLYLVEDGDGPSCQCCYCMTRHAALTNRPTLTCGCQISVPPDRSVVVVVVVEAAAAGPGGAPCGRSVSTLLAPATPRYIYTISTLYTGHHICTQGDTGPGVVTIIAGDTGQSGDTVTASEDLTTQQSQYTMYLYMGAPPPPPPAISAAAAAGDNVHTVWYTAQ